MAITSVTYPPRNPKPPMPEPDTDERLLADLADAARELYFLCIAEDHLDRTVSTMARLKVLIDQAEQRRGQR